MAAHRLSATAHGGLCDPRGMRRTAVLIYLAIFIGEVVWTSLVPLVPTYSDRFDLSKLEAGGLLAAASLTILLASIPATMLSDRYGARAVTLVAVGGMAVADVGQALADRYWMLLVARAVRDRVRGVVGGRGRLAGRGSG